MPGNPPTVGIPIFEDVEELDFVGPWEVFGAAREGGADLQLISVAEKPGLLRCAHGLQVAADRGFGEVPTLDVLAIPGGFGTRKAIGSAATLQWM
jgi:putative intracellular protease/amidase